MHRALRSIRPAVRWGGLGVGVAVALTAAIWPGSAEVDFNGEVRPIINAKCISCHGGVKRAGGLSLLFRSDALQRTESGKFAIVPGDPDASELLRRVRHHDPDERMPLDGAPLSDSEIDVLRRWIEQGANWDDHWAYVRPVERPLPEVSDPKWPRSGLDRLVLARLDREGLRPSPPADCTTLVRRAALDLTGLPPTPGETDAACADPSGRGYERAVDRLLASPHFGEHWAAMWLDLARYADTKGYERDVHRNIWRYRDWVIDAFNRDLPFDSFTIAQVAGDLLPGGTDQHLLATAFHRNTMTNDEGGTDDEEFRVAAVIDRVNTTWEVWQGTTMSCVQCHSHPYDPIRHEEYYRAMAFFDNTMDADWNDEHPRLPTYAAADESKLRALLASLVEMDGGSRGGERGSLFQHVERSLYPRGRIAASSYTVSSSISQENEFISPKSDGAHVRYEGMDLTGVEEITFGYAPGGEGAAVEVRLDSPTGPMIARAPLPSTGRKGFQESSRVRVEPTAGKRVVYFVMRRPKGGYRIHWFYLHQERPGVDPRRAGVISELQQAMAAVTPEVETPVLMDRPAGHGRVTRVFERGNFLVKGDTVLPGVPGSLPPMPRGSPANRLGLAQWLVAPENPLTARVTVNRFWAQLFGTGIVETLEDFGTEGAAPSDQALLDWLALRFVHHHDWSVKALLREVVLSSTYRQSSRVTPELLERDPANRLLARGPRVRLSAEQVRDQALAVGGLLSGKLLGPSVMPPQPPGLWTSPYNSNDWQTAEGEDRYRRGVYTYWKRTVPYPSAMAFDATSREVCVSRRVRTNTPLQALVTLNDPVFVEAAQGLARRMEGAGRTVDERLRFGYREALLRDPDPATLTTLRRMHANARAHYRAQPDELALAVEPFMPYDTASAYDLRKPKKKDGSEPRQAPEAAPALREPVGDRLEVAALTTVAGVILNLDRFLTKE